MSEPKKPVLQRIEVSTDDVDSFIYPRCTFCYGKAVTQDRDGVRRCLRHQAPR